MSTVVRDAVIRLRLDTKQDRLETPKVDEAARAYKETAKATKEVEVAQKEVVKQTKETTQAVNEFGIKSLNAFREAGEGAFRMTRGLALLSASGSEDLQKLIRNVALAQGAFDVFAGGAKVFTSLAATLGGPVAIAVTGVTSALAVGGLAWQRYQKNAEQAAAELKKRLDEVNESLKKATAEAAAERDKGAARREGRIGAALTPGEREARIRDAIAREESLVSELRPRAGGNAGGLPATMAGWRDLVESQRGLSSSFDRQADLQRDLFDIQRQQIEAQRSIAQQVVSAGISAGAAAGFGFGAAGANLAGQAFLGQIDTAERELTARFQTLIDGLMKLVNEGIDRADRIERALNQTFTE